MYHAAKICACGDDELLHVIPCTQGSDDARHPVPLCYDLCYLSLMDIQIFSFLAYPFHIFVIANTVCLYSQ